MHTCRVIGHGEISIAGERVAFYYGYGLPVDSGLEAQLFRTTDNLRLRGFREHGSEEVISEALASRREMFTCIS